MATQLLEDSTANSDGISGYASEVKQEFDSEKEKPRIIAAEIEHRINTLDGQIDKHFNQQHIENDKMQHDLTELKGDKSTINMQLIQCEQKLKDIELAIGIEIPNDATTY